MIELLLNAAWLVLVAGAVTRFLRKNSRRADQKAFLLSLGALVCAASLLLPSISITDDLHFEAFVVEDSNATKRMANAGAQAAPAVPLVWLAAVFCGILVASQPRVGHRLILSRLRSSVSYGFIQPRAGRAPPRGLAA